MDLNWFQNLIYGMVSGIAEILPVSAQAHRLVLQKIFGTQYIPGFTLLLIHVGIFAAVFLSCQNHLLRMQRAKHLSRIPKKRRKRPLDLVCLMDYHLLMTMLLPVVLAFIAGIGILKHEDHMLLVSIFLILNGIVLYLPQYLPGSNKDARTLTRLNGLCIGVGTAFAALPGISAIGMATSVGQALGEDRKYSFQMALLLECFILVILIIEDFIRMAGIGLAGMSVSLVMRSILSCIGAFGTSILGIRIMRRMAENNGYAVFGQYCWAVAMISLLLTLLV